METKIKLPSAQTSRSAGTESRKDSASSSVSVPRDPTPTVQFKHRLSTTGGVPIYVQERLEERQRRVRMGHTCMGTVTHTDVHTHTHTHTHTFIPGQFLSGHVAVKQIEGKTF